LGGPKSQLRRDTKKELLASTGTEHQKPSQQPVTLFSELSRIIIIIIIIIIITIIIIIIVFVLGCNWPYLAVVKHVNKLIELLL
jgi:hypothetical protein